MCLRSPLDRKSTRLNSSHPSISYAVFCLKKKKTHQARGYAYHTSDKVSSEQSHHNCDHRVLSFVLYTFSLTFLSMPSTLFPFFFFIDTATTEIYTLSLHDALPISPWLTSSRCGLPYSSRSCISLVKRLTSC